MDRRTFVTAGLLLAAGGVVIGPSAATAGESGAAEAAEPAPLRTVPLPKPDLKAGAPLMECLALRRSNRHISREELPLDVLGGILWAAAGVNRESGKRTIPTARNRQEIAVYAVRGDGVWKYLPAEHAIGLVLEGDQRSRFDNSGCVLLYATPADDRFGGAHAGSAYQGAGLYCAWAGLANCVKYQKHDALDKELPLPKGWAVCITQSIGYPAAKG